jgi:glutathione S-transferase
MAKRFTLYGTPGSAPSYKAALMLALSQEPYSYVFVDFAKRENRTPDFLAKSRYGEVPCLLDGELAICQSAAIVLHLAETLGKFDGQSIEEKVRIREWMFWDFDRLMPNLYRALAIKDGFWSPHQSLVDEYKLEGAVGLKRLERWLAKHDWLVGGRPTAADIEIYGIVHFASRAGFDLAQTSKVAAWGKRIETLPGFATADALLTNESRP